MGHAFAFCEFCALFRFLWGLCTLPFDSSALQSFFRALRCVAMDCAFSTALRRAAPSAASRLLLLGCQANRDRLNLIERFARVRDIRPICLHPLDQNYSVIETT